MENYIIDKIINKSTFLNRILKFLTYLDIFK